ncbi:MULTISPECIES: ATP-dependent DNA helicase RecG [unclassified Microbacterium]|uniref:ATP-dependent DNA helicase RecG n=1 Tax=unclassified Microbacterium TaxID=2609290 RepID=UPI000CFBA37D|nr:MULTISPECIES: ATP-dependent DNA helicase RecG [unclassified Microbacterium]PQZ61185.1 ATP-dependent DNA helicase RecG [Microbacterium sp. MYb43]PQZ82397.1 ATP-dependent DNA helicase RecG [Microbacterium sp. MYb40]PRB23905.1 ATP-dependent DNA helicase RecG [Microbacterium sp. MYb54]PRB29800.1 ATP-dependent DNA helicase RecG [Microbacterium sp. MYb50]PRB70843.1 ATP-dependent DNA helicase RecG [Microbacterium sp. MYb24]
MSLTLDSSLEDALGAASAKTLGRAFSMKSVGDLLAHYPRRYADPGELTPIRDLPLGETVTIVAEVLSSSFRRMRNRPGAMVDVVIGDGIGRMSLTFFAKNVGAAEWRSTDLAVGRRGVFSGKVGKFNGMTQFAHPEYELFDDEDSARRSADARAAVPIPIYPATSAIQTWQIARLIGRVLDDLPDAPDPLSADIREGEELLTAREALELVHRPRTRNDIDPAVRTLRMHEALTLQTALLQQRDAIRALSATSRPALPAGLLERFDASLPYTLTPDQETVGQQISADLVGAWPMNRLVQGEVGSGKTLVALRAMLQVAESGGQAALIAPTEVLAGQHLRSIAKMLGPELSPILMPTLLTGQMPAAERRKAALRVASGQALIVVGTHALLGEKTTFADLGLVVVDEQHRFGVEQREALRAKGSSPHALVLTATPIPRTVAMTVFGDLDTSVIRTMPAGRAGIESFVAPLSEHPGWFNRVWERAAEEIAQGRQVFAVCAAIDTAKKTAEAGEPAALAPEGGTGPRWGVVQLDEALATHPTLGGLRRAVLHGRMPSDEKDAVMQAFARGDIDLLLATTVIEVGVDVPNASTMIVLDADRFGVSQLHQLRGRVGRGGVPGLCLLVTETEAGSLARDRVDAVAATLDGFALAEVDLELRGEGDVLGAAQAGVRSSLKLLRVVKDAGLISRAREVAEGILAADPDLTGHPGLREAIGRRVSDEDRAALAKN